MNRKKVIVWGAAACAGAVLIGTGLWFWLGRDGGSDSGNVVYVNSVDSLMNPGNTGGILNRFAGVVETQESLEIPASSDQTVKEVYVEEGQEVQVGTPLFIYDTEKTSEELEKAQLDLERISNEIGNKYNELAALEKEKKTADKSSQIQDEKYTRANCRRRMHIRSCREVRDRGGCRLQIRRGWRRAGPGPGPLRP